MKKLILILLLGLIFILTGCSKKTSNTLNITNETMAPIILNFRGTTYTINVGITQTLNDIPNGAYKYEGTIGIPSAAYLAAVLGTAVTSVTPTLGAGISDKVMFNGSTRCIILYSAAVTVNNAVATYTANATITSSDPLTGT